MERKPKILIGIPGFLGIQAEAQEHALGLLFRCGRDMPEYDFAVKVVTKKEQFRARNQLVDVAIGGDFEYLLMLDDDMLMGADLVKRLVAHDKDVVGGLYYQRGGAFHPVAMRRVWKDEGNWTAHFLPLHDPILTQPGLHEVDIIGGGCMLFKVDVFRKLTPPYFWWESSLGTDVAICSRLQDAGVHIYLDSTVELGHLGDKPIISSKTVPQYTFERGTMLEALWEDAKAYLAMGDEELRSKMEQAAGEKTRRQYWDMGDRSAWEGIRSYYTSYPEWHVLGLLYFAFHHPDRFHEWTLLRAPIVLPSDAVVLDLGPGIGDKTIPMAAKHGYRVYAADIEKAPTLDFLRWRAERHGLTGTSRRCVIPWAFTEPVPERDLPEKVDCVLMISMLEHLPDPFGTLKWVARQIKPGGTLVCDYACLHDEDEPQHLLRYDPATLTNWLHEHGWRVALDVPWIFTRTED